MNSLEDRVIGVHLFPIKSCQEATIDGELPKALVVGETGFEHAGVADRALVIKDETDLFVSQRGWNANHARKHVGDTALAGVAVDISGGLVTISAVSHGSLTLPAHSVEAESHPVQIFGPELVATDLGDESAQFFSELLGRAVRLVKADPHHPRMLGTSYQRPGAANMSAGADGRPFSVASQASLDYLHELIRWPVGRLPMNRFRASIDIAGDGFGPFGEDKVAKWEIARVTMYGVKALSRCPMPNFNQETGEDDRLSTQLLSKTRMGWPVATDITQRAEPIFAQSLNHVIPEAEDRIVEVGDIVTAIEVTESNAILKANMLR